VRGYLDAAERAAQDQRRKQAGFDVADKEVGDFDVACTQASDVLAAARADATAELQKVIGRWTGAATIAVLIPAGAPILIDALEAIGEPDAPALPEVFRSLTDERRTSARAQRRSSLWASSSAPTRRLGPSTSVPPPAPPGAANACTPWTRPLFEMAWQQATPLGQPAGDGELP
jgi:hypothetical protein